MNRQEAEDYIYISYYKAEKYWDYDAPDSVKRRPDLSRGVIESLKKAPCVVVTGSKGKGSVAFAISRILMTSLKVGTLTSPHITSFSDRFRINMKPIDDDDFVKYMEIAREKLDPIEKTLAKDVCISPIAIQTVFAMEFFNAYNTDFNVFECGKGALYDDVNNVPHEYAVINSIFPEHLRELGPTLSDIARNKAAVIKKGMKCVYIGQQSEDVLQILLDRAYECGVPARVYGRDFEASEVLFADGTMTFSVHTEKADYKELAMHMLGEHQARNCALALAVCEDVLGERFDIAKVKEALLEIKVPGRLELVNKKPLVYLDACINRKSCEPLLDVFSKTAINKVTLVVGIPDDKDFAGVVDAMKGIAERIILTRSQNIHYVFTPMQVERLAELGIAATWTDSVSEAMELAFSASKKDGNPILILGTTSLVTEVERFSFQ